MNRKKKWTATYTNLNQKIVENADVIFQCELKAMVETTVDFFKYIYVIFLDIFVNASR